jgi:hypothetical protein
MSDERKTRVLSIRTADDIIEYIEVFRHGQIAMPTQTEALRVLVRLGFEKWKEQGRVAEVVDSRIRPSIGAPG